MSKVVHIHIALEVPEDATDTAGTIGRILSYGLAMMRLDWKVKKAQ